MGAWGSFFCAWDLGSCAMIPVSATRSILSRQDFHEAWKLLIVRPNYSTVQNGGTKKQDKDHSAFRAGWMPWRKGWGRVRLRKQAKLSYGTYVCSENFKQDKKHGVQHFLLKGFR